VLRALLDSGEACALAADQPGEMDATFFGVHVQTRSGAAALARRAGAPLVVFTTWHDDERFGVHVSRPLQVEDFGSTRALHQAVLSEVENQLDGDISRFLGELHTAPATADARS
jgi:lauroyl/myristoyl acyltransferase